MASPVADPTCETALTAPKIADFEAKGATLTQVSGAPDSVMASLLDQGGISCYWLWPTGETLAWYGQADMEAEAWSVELDELTAQGYTESNDPIPGALQAPLASDTGSPMVVHTDGVTYYVSRAYLLPSVAALQ